MLDESVQQ
ncbi:hypothetical protein JL09_g6967 [Pichia kudriavzevii]|uniref:Uncharacterized protein n=1 Tax=Pichia kudriavzevii TaxID=4909 RepID=A0A099NKJ9_PICKU|nr:hypothetical protein JL09_g6971 [Pichia kudriavzevii]KGK32426.1 hypothetical protein JL09_g6967 [Pichia kudriavzevii]